MVTCSILARGKSRVGLPINTRRCNSCRRSDAVDLFVLVFGASRSEEVMIVSVPFAFQVRLLQELVKLETELARRTACRAQFERLKSEKLSPCSSYCGNLKDSMLEIVQRCLDHCHPARSYFLKRQRPAPY